MRTGQTLELFPLSNVGIGPSVEEREQREWSYSRRSLLGRCLLAYFYEYYASSKRFAGSESERRKVKVLKRLRNRHLRAGDIAHIVIAGYLKALQRGDGWSEERLLSWALSIHQKDGGFSRGYPANAVQGETQFAPVPLVEFYYRLPNAEELWRESGDRLVAGLRQFIRSEEFGVFRDAARSQLARIEKRVSIKQTRFKMRGKIDLGFSSAGRVSVVDWKLGNSSGGGDHLQLVAYALGAGAEFNVDPEGIDLFYGYLQDGTVDRFSVHQHEIERAEARIEQDLERMEALDRYGRQGIPEAFTPCAQPRICSGCAYREICPVGGIR